MCTRSLDQTIGALYLHSIVAYRSLYLSSWAGRRRGAVSEQFVLEERGEEKGCHGCPRVVFPEVFLNKRCEVVRAKFKHWAAQRFRDVFVHMFIGKQPTTSLDLLAWQPAAVRPVLNVTKVFLKRFVNDSKFFLKPFVKQMMPRSRCLRTRRGGVSTSLGGTLAQRNHLAQHLARPGWDGL